MIRELENSLRERLLPLLSGLSEDAQQLLQAEFRLALIEAKESVVQYKKAGLALAIAVVMLCASYLGVLILLGRAIEARYPESMPMYWGVIIISNCLGAAGALYIAGQKSACSENFPTQSLASLEKTMKDLNSIVQ